MKNIYQNVLKSVCLPCLLLAAVQPAQAEWKPGKHMAESMAINLALGKSIEKKTDYGFCNTCYLGAYIQVGNDSVITTQLESGRAYLFAGAVEKGNDLDIIIEDQDGEKVAKDTKDDNIPVVEFVPRRTAQYTIRLKLYKAQSAQFCGLVLMQKGGWSVPMNNLETAAGMALRHCQRVAEVTSAKFMEEPGEWAIIGRILDDEEECRFSDMRLGTGRRVIVTGTDSKSQDTDLAAYRDGSSRIRLSSDTESDNQPILQLETKQSSRYTIEITNARSNGPSLVMTALLDVD